MRFGLASAAIAAWLAMTACVTTTGPRDTLYDQCGDQTVEAEARVQACTAAIADGGRYDWELPYLYTDRAKAWSYLGDHAQAVADATKAVDLNPKESVLLLTRAMIHVEAGKSGSAIKDLTAAIALEPEKPEAYRMRGMLLVWLGYYAKGLVDIDAALRLSPPTAVDQFSRGKAYLRLKQPLFALAALSEGIRLGGKSSEAFALRADAKRQLMDLPGAVADIEQAFQINAKNAEAYSVRSWIRHDQGDDEKAIADIDEAARLEPDNFYYQGNRCTLRLIAAREFDQALAACTATLALRPRHPDILSARGVILLKRGQVDDAAADFGACLDDQLSKVEAERDALDHAFCLYGRALTALKNPSTPGLIRDSARNDLRAAETIRPDVPHTFASYGLTP
ncbi:MAG: tetratricopeptide repeat protein [Hyphomonadaceae bacterium]